MLLFIYWSTFSWRAGASSCDSSLSKEAQVSLTSFSMMDRCSACQSAALLVPPCWIQALDIRSSPAATENHSSGLSLELYSFPHCWCPPPCSGVTWETASDHLTALAPDCCLNNGGKEHAPLRPSASTSPWTGLDVWHWGFCTFLMGFWVSVKKLKWMWKLTKVIVSLK